MAYARFGADGSDVYVYLSVGGHLECCGCLLGDNWAFHSTEELLIHLGEHRRVGHTVPQSCIDALKEDQEENDNWIAKYRPELDQEKNYAYNNRVAFSRDVEGRFLPFYGFYRWGTPEQEASYNRDLPKRTHIGDRISRQFAGDNPITFNDLHSYLVGYVKVIERIKAAIEAGNKHYGSNETYIRPWRGDPMYPVGTRVGAILSADEECVKFLGWGTYDGNFTPLNITDEAIEEAVKSIIEFAPDQDEAEIRKRLAESPLFSNPRITLDNGDVVWGYQCWWGPADQFTEEWFNGREVIEVRIGDILAN